MEPVSITAGTTVEWSRPDVYAYGLWVYEYTFTGPATKTVTAAGADGEVTATITAAGSSAWAAGKYQWFLFRTKDADKILVAEGYLQVVGDPAAVTAAVDHRTHAEIMVEKLEARIQGRVDSDHESYTTYDGRALARIPFEQLNKYLTYYRNQMVRDQRKAAGKKPARRVIYRMS